MNLKHLVLPDISTEPPSTHYIHTLTHILSLSHRHKHTHTNEAYMCDTGAMIRAPNDQNGKSLTSKIMLVYYLKYR